MLGAASCLTGCSDHKMERCKLTIDLDRGDGVYYVGKKLSGVVRIELDEPLAITGLELRLFGGSFVSWTEKKPKKVRSTIEHSAEEVYFDDTFVLWGQGRNSLNPNIEELPRGRHMFPFQWPIPQDVPCSYEGPFGWVRYHAQCALLHPCCKPGCNTSLTSRAFFTVIRQMDLNAEDEWNLPVHEHREMTLHTALCQAGKVTCTLELTRSGYVPGEYRPTSVDIHNMCPKKIRSTTLTLRQILTFGSEEQNTRKVSWDICRVHGDQVKQGRHQCWSSGKGILIPSLVPSTLAGCKYIDIRYELVLLIDLQSNSLVITTPIVIGTAPIMGNYLTSWKYKDGLQYRSRKKRRTLTRSRSSGLLRPHEIVDIGGTSEFHPKYRVYNADQPRKTLVVLECSPGERRKSVAKVSLRLPPDNLESVV